jgi:EAL domain-containing protein (putative c-di-GMP-specific phosphodiesterase class I)
VKALFLGAEDLTADLQCKRTKEGREIEYARTRLVVAARAAGGDVYDTPFTDVNDDEGIWKDAQLAKALGFTVALDDIGSGYTSLRNICEYPIDLVELDRAMLLMANTERGKKLFHGIVSLMHFLDLKFVCEGVETEEQNAFVSNSDCDLVQGWYYSTALSEPKAEAFAKEYMGAL